MDATNLFFPERRLYARTQLQVTIRGLRMDPGGDLVDTFHMLDISRGGLGAIVDRPYYRGQRVVMSLPVLDDGTRRSVYASVVRCRGDRDGYHVGLRFEGSGDAMRVDHTKAVLAAA
jgi:hypothetical protein